MFISLKTKSNTWQTGIAFALAETEISKPCAAWFIISFNTIMPLYCGVSVGSYNDYVQDLKSKDLLFFKGKFKFKTN